MLRMPTSSSQRSSILRTCSFLPFVCTKYSNEWSMNLGRNALDAIGIMSLGTAVDFDRQIAVHATQPCGLRMNPSLFPSRVVVAATITMVPSTSILGFTVWILFGSAKATSPPALRFKGIVPQNNPRQLNTLSATTPPRIGPSSAAKPTGMLSSPVHFARCEDGKRSPTTAKHRG
jgi:hypothetical protein